MHVPERSSVYRTVARSTAIAAFALVIAAPAALAAPPTHAPAVSIEVLVPGGDYCEHDVVLTNPTFRCVTRTLPRSRTAPSGSASGAWPRRGRRM